MPNCWIRFLAPFDAVEASKPAAKVMPSRSLLVVYNMSIQVSQGFVCGPPISTTTFLVPSYLVGSKQMYLFSSELFAWALVPRCAKVRAMTRVVARMFAASCLACRTREAKYRRIILDDKTKR